MSPPAVGAGAVQEVPAGLREAPRAPPAAPATRRGLRVLPAAARRAVLAAGGWRDRPPRYHHIDISKYIYKYQHLLIILSYLSKLIYLCKINP